MHYKITFANTSLLINAVFCLDISMKGSSFDVTQFFSHVILSSNMGLTVNDLILKPFSTRTKDEQLQIILGGKPRPKKYKAEYYEKEQWLTACEVRNTFFCWSCLLFESDGSSVWSSCGFGDLTRLFSAMDTHKCSQEHINGVLQLQMFLNANLVEVKAPPENKLSSSVKKNRDVVKYVIDVVCHITTSKLPASNGTNTCERCIVEDCVEHLTLLKKYDMRNISDEAINLIKEFPNVLIDIVSTLSGLVTLAIKDEVQSSHLVSLILSEHSDIEFKSKLSTVMRYVKDGKVQERFIGFSNFIIYKTSNIIDRHHIAGILEKYDIGKKFFTLSCDGAVMSQRHLKALLALLKSKYPYFYLTPCYFHDFDFVLEQSLLVFRECRLFFQNLKSIKYFLQHSSKIRRELNAFLSDNIPNLCDFKLSNSHFLRVLKLHRHEFVQFFQGIVKKPAEYSEEDVAKASGFTIILNDYLTIFLLETFYLLFSHTAIFSETLSSCYPENVFEKSVIDNIETTLKSNKESVDPVWSLLVAEMSEKSKKEVSDLEQSKRTCYPLFNQIMDHTIAEIQIRLRCLEKLNFFHILNSEHHGKLAVYDDYIGNLMAVYQSSFNETILRNELKVINSNGSVLVKNSIYEFLENLVSMNVKDTFKNVNNLAELILSMPCKRPSSSTGNVSKFDAIKAWAESGGISDDLSFLAIEKDILHRIKSEDKFYDEFMRKFQTLNSIVQVT